MNRTRNQRVSFRPRFVPAGYRRRYASFIFPPVLFCPSVAKWRNGNARRYFGGRKFTWPVNAYATQTVGVIHEMKLSQMKSDFISNVSYELRTPAILDSRIRRVPKIRLDG